MGDSLLPIRHYLNGSTNVNDTFVGGQLVPCSHIDVQDMPCKEKWIAPSPPARHKHKKIFPV
jgi:hypothetical protein